MNPTQLYERLLDLHGQRTRFAVCTVTASRGSAPRKPGAKMLVHYNGCIEGTIGGGAIEQKVIDTAVIAVAAGKSTTIDQHLTHDLGMCCGGGMTVFIDVQTPAPRLYVFGCGHVGRPIALMAAQCGFEVRVFDGRPAFAKPDLFAADIEVVCAPPEDVLPTLPFSAEDTYVVVVTHDHGLDEAIVAEIMVRPFTFLGCIGSRRKAAKFRARLEARGLPAATIARLRTPMGLDIAAETPEEIAVSVVAELVQVRRGG